MNILSNNLYFAGFLWRVKTILFCVISGIQNVLERTKNKPHVNDSESYEISLLIHLNADPDEPKGLFTYFIYFER